MKVLVVFVPLALLASACGPRFAPEALEAAADMPTPVEISASETPSGVASQPSAGASESEPPALAATQTSAPEATPSPDFGPRHNNGVVRIELSATCVRPGDLLVVTLRTPPKAGLGMIIGYSDNQAHGAMLTGESDANGVYVWRVPVDPTVPDGPARVLVTSTGANWEGQGGTADATFRVARAGC